MEHTIELIIECQECGHPNDYTLSIRYSVCPDHIKPPKWVCPECGLEQAFDSNNVIPSAGYSNQEEAMDAESAEIRLRDSATEYDESYKNGQDYDEDRGDN